MLMESPAPLIAPIISVLGAVLIALLSIRYKNKKLYDALSLIASLASWIIALIVFYDTICLKNMVVYGSGGWFPPLGIVYVVDGLSSILGLLNTTIVLLIIVYSIGYFKEEEKGIYQYYVLVLLLNAALLGVYYTGDLFNLFVMIELMAVTAYSLVAYHRERGEAIEASLKYGIVACLAGLLLFIGIGFIYSYIGTVSMPDLSAKIIGLHTLMDKYSGSAKVFIGPLLLIVGLITWSFLFESAVFPLHFWLPDAHSEAPSPVSALLSGLVVNAGLYGLIRFYYTVIGAGINDSRIIVLFMEFLLLVGVLGSIYAAIMMIMENDIKRIIAYSTIMHVSLIIIGVSLGTKAGIQASIYHFITHSISKSLAFLSVGVLVTAAGSRKINDLMGFAKYYPTAGAGAVIAMLGLAGMPPLGTFPSKLFLITAAIDSGNPYAAAAIIISSVIAVIAYFRIINVLLNEKPKNIARYTFKNSTKTTIWILIMLVVFVGIMLPIMYNLSGNIASSLMDPRRYIDSALKLLIKFYR